MGGILKYYDGSEWIPVGQPDPLYARAVINDMVYPIGSIYINATDDTNPADLLGVGTWVAWGVGKAIVGIDTGDTDFDTAEETGGEKTHTLTTAEMPVHTHNIGGHSNGDFIGTTGGGQGGWSLAMGGTNNNIYRIHTKNAGSGNAHNNLQPYQVGYVWKRTA